MISDVNASEEIELKEFRVSTPQVARTLMKQLQIQHVIAAVQRVDAGEGGGFSESTKYDLLLNGKRYAPKRVVGLALYELSGTPFGPYAFKGGEASLCFRSLQRLGFDVVDKECKSYPVGEAVEFHVILTRLFHSIVTHPYLSPAGSRCG
ncbi:hypothetical protein [Rhizobacter fulvus]